MKKLAVKSIKPAVQNAKRRVPRAGRPTSALITRQAAADAALSMIDLNGLEALSLQSVARLLGVSAPSLYHHFRDKEELLTHVARRLLQKVGSEQKAWSSEWELRMVELSLATRRVMLRHPNAAPLALRYFPRQVMLTAYENSLVDCPYPPQVQMVVSDLIEKFTYGSSLFAAAAEAYHIAAMPSVDPNHFPTLASALELAPNDEEVFVEALHVLLDGLRSRYGKSNA